MNARLKKPRLCSVEGCDRPHKARGFCEMHRARAAAGRPLGGRIQKVKPVEEKRARTTSGAVQLAYTLPAETARQLAEVAGDGYGATSRVVRQAITQFLENRDTSFWRGKYMTERTARMALQQKLDEVRRAIG